LRYGQFEVDVRWRWWQRLAVGWPFVRAACGLARGTGVGLFVGCGAAALRRGERGGPPVGAVGGQRVVLLEQFCLRCVAEQGDVRWRCLLDVRFVGG
jgi:hypothetical protein